MKQQPKDRNFNPKKQIAISRLANGSTQIEVAEELGVCRTTIWNWVQDEKFRNAIKDEVRRNFEQSTGLAYTQIEKLATTAKNENVRLNACKEILDRSGMIVKQDINLNNSADIVVEFINPVIEGGDAQCR